jgi:NRPS condensation-like uncharacterized protein
MSKKVPQERFSEFVAWMFPLIGYDDRENMIRIIQMNIPAQAFGGVKEVIKKAIGGDWDELKRRVPTL